MKIALGSDHVGYMLKCFLMKDLERRDIEYLDLGTSTSAERTDYPIWGEKVARAVAEGRFDRGILVCGTGVGISLAANKVDGIRAVVCSDCYTAGLSRRHNDTNVLALGSMVVGEGLALRILDTWLNAEFEGGRHAGRVGMLNKIEKNESF